MNKKYLKKIYDFLADFTHKLNPVRSSRLILNWYDFYGKIVFQWFIRFELKSVYLILNILERKEQENLNNFSVKITPNLKIADFYYNFANFRRFFDSILIKFLISIEIIYILVFAFLNF